MVIDIFSNTEYNFPSDDRQYESESVEIEFNPRPIASFHTNSNNVYVYLPWCIKKEQP